MRHITCHAVATASLAFAALAAAQSQTPTPAPPSSTPPPPPHVIVVKLVQRDGAIPFAFDPPVDTVVRGDTVRFVEAADVIHNVRFVSHAPGAKLGAASVGPYLTKLGESYDVIIDSRFTDGTYAFVCDPHAMIGMKGTLVVTEHRVAAAP
jgi:plastocyanin